MRNTIVAAGADKLTYEIREIVAVGHKLQSFGRELFWENIGDPVAKGHTIPSWIKDIIIAAISESDKAFAYSPSKGLLEAREFIAEQRNNYSICDNSNSNRSNNANNSKNNTPVITADDILFFNGLGDAISKIYTNLNKTTRVIGPDPAYPTHSSAEAAHAGSPHLTYSLNPNNNWLPDLEDLRRKIISHPEISGILIINPDNPTGMVYPKEVLQEIVSIAREYDLFIISDEIYANIFYHADTITLLHDIIKEVPGIAMRGLSKEIPWPGARCGWIEFYNKEKDVAFARYTKSLVDAKMLEVCSTTLPQYVLPKILSDSRYAAHLKDRSQFYNQRAEIAYNILASIPDIIVTKPSGAFYMSVVFKQQKLTSAQTLNIENTGVKKYIERLVKQLPSEKNDKRFVYYLLAATGICVVPLSGFNSVLPGFRITLLEPDEQKFKTIMRTVAESIKNYLNS